MIRPHSSAEDPRIQSALDELKGMITQRYPGATFEVREGQDQPEQVHVITTVDVDDPDEVLDVVIDRVLHFQVEEGLPVHVIPVRPLNRVMEELGSLGDQPGPGWTGKRLGLLPNHDS